MLFGGVISKWHFPIDLNIECKKTRLTFTLPKHELITGGNRAISPRLYYVIGLESEGVIWICQSIESIRRTYDVQSPTNQAILLDARPGFDTAYRDTPKHTSKLSTKLFKQLINYIEYWSVKPERVWVVAAEGWVPKAEEAFPGTARDVYDNS